MDFKDHETIGFHSVKGEPLSVTPLYDYFAALLLCRGTCRFRRLIYEHERPSWIASFRS